MSRRKLPSLHLVDGDGQLAAPVTIAKFLNLTVALVAPENGSEEDLLNASSSPTQKVSPLALKTNSVMSSASLNSTDASLRAASAVIHAHIKQVVGIKYHVVGVFGGQSSGKSTLLNHVFGTSFQTMDESSGRHQTTKGAFLAVTDSETIGESAPTEPISSPILVVDFEGTDGAERGENQSFERQLSLFALSIADTLIINMWTVEVGRFNAANLSLLRTVFEVNLQLFSHDANLENEKPTLLFVMRDHTSPSITANAARVKESIDRIWESIHKPPGREGCTIDRLFNLEYFGFPHYELQKDQFFESVGTFRSLFVQRGGGGDKSVFRSPNTFRGIPLEALPPYLHNCWQAILKSKDLDIPSQREMLSRFRCKDLADEQLAAFRTECDDFVERMNSKGELIPKLKDTLQTSFEAKVDAYIEETKLYSTSIGKDHQERLEAEMHAVYEATMKVYCQVMVADAVRNIDGEIHAIIDDCIKTNIWANEAILATTRLPLGTAGTGAASEFDFTDRHLKSTVTAFWKSMEQRVRKLCDSTADPRKLAIFGRSQDILEEDLVLRDMVTGRLVVAIEERIRKRLEGMANDSSVAMQKTFEYVLNHEDTGAMKIYDSVTDLQRRFRAARTAGLVLAACIFYYRLKVDDDLLDSDADEDVNSEDAERDLSRTQSQGLFAKTVRAFTAARVSFNENAQEAAFQLKLGTAHVGPEPADISSSSSGLPGDMEYPALPKALSDVLASPRPGAAKAPGTPRDVATTPRDAASAGASGISLHRILMSKSALKRALELYFQQIFFAIQIQTKNVEARGNGNHIPVWMWGLLVYLGYDDILNLLMNPVLLIILIATVMFFFSTAVEAQWKKFEKDGPPVVVHALKVAYTYVGPYIEEIRKQTTPLAEIGKEDAQAQPSEVKPKHQDPTQLDAAAVAAAKRTKQD